MPSCTFFGHRFCPDAIRPKLCETLIDLIEKCGVDMFYVGQQGAFDAMALSVLRELMVVYPRIRYAVVLERMPAKRDEFDMCDYSDTMLPEGVETVHPRFAIVWRNRWMVRHSDYAVIYVTHAWGGAAQFSEMARRQGKICINVAEKL